MAEIKPKQKILLQNLIVEFISSKRNKFGEHVSYFKIPDYFKQKKVIYYIDKNSILMCQCGKQTQTN